jgi:PAS domain S-box-containing protein
LFRSATVTHPDDLEPIGRTFKGSLIGDEYGIRSRIVRKDGGIRHIHGRGVVTSDAAGRPLKILAIVQDITDYINEDISLKENQRSFRTSSRRARTWGG